MSLLVRAALLGGLAYVVSRAVRNSQRSLDSSRLEPQRLVRTPDFDETEPTPVGSSRSLTDMSTGA